MVNAIVMTIGIQKDDIQKKLAAMNSYKVKFIESLYLDSHNPRYQKVKEKSKVNDRSIVDKVAGFSGPKPRRG